MTTYYTVYKNFDGNSMAVLKTTDAVYAYDLVHAANEFDGGYSISDELGVWSDLDKHPNARNIVEIFCQLSGEGVRRHPQQIDGYVLAK